jgi:hypothetical protein
MSNRVTAEQVLEAYRVTGIQPCRRNPYNCALGALAQQNKEHYLHDYVVPLYGESYKWGFFDGFDGREAGSLYAQSVEQDLTRYDEGFEDGTKAANAVFGDDTP